MLRSARLTINRQALRHNLQRAKRAAPNSRVMAVIKADAYGHGMLEVAEILNEANGFAVACMDEALALRHAGFLHPILVLQGFQNKRQLIAAAEHNLRVVLHDETQLTLLDHTKSSKKLNVALKLDTGMHRLGFPYAQGKRLYQKLSTHPNTYSGIWLMTHFSCADDVQDQYTVQQLKRFSGITDELEPPYTRTLANSAGILAWPQSHAEWIRPGIMLYGSSPFIQGDARKEGLQAVMHLHAPLIAVHTLKKGSAIGYGATWECPEDMTVGVVGMGYGDGYPRHAKTGTPVSVNGQRSQLLGRVSMDTVVIDLRDIEAEVGDYVELWGDQIAVDEVARYADTISYELFCKMGAMCSRQYKNLPKN